MKRALLTGCSLALGLVLVLALTHVGACGGGSNPTGPADMTALPPDMMCKPDPAFKSECGLPCDKGNSKGVGKFCKVLSDCFDNNEAALCTQLDPSGSSQYFCTMKCKVDADCGENARCACQGNQCGCFPTACDGPVDGGVGG